MANEFMRYSSRDQAYLTENGVQFPQLDFFGSKMAKRGTMVELLRNYDEDKRLNQDMKDVLKSLGFKDATPIQAVAIPEVLAGKDIIGISKTGSGKTLAFSLPMVMKMMCEMPTTESDEKTGRRICLPRVLVLTPTRELCLQITNCINDIAAGKISAVAIYGGLGKQDQIKKLEKEEPIIIVATPGRLMDVMRDNVISTKMVKLLVLDEADRMLDRGFLNDVEEILKPIPKKRQTLLFSATWSDDLRDIVKANMNTDNLFRVSVSSDEINKDIMQIPVVIGEFQKMHVLGQLVGRIYCGFKILVFFNRKDTVERLVEYFCGEKIAPVYAFSSAINQEGRESLINRFRQGTIRVLFATDCASRGLDIDDIHLVINYDMPAHLPDYVHRIGRTGRNGKYGQAISFIMPNFRATRNFAEYMEVLEGGTSHMPKEFQVVEEVESEDD